MVILLSASNILLAACFSAGRVGGAGIRAVLWIKSTFYVVGVSAPFSTWAATLAKATPDRAN